METRKKILVLGQVPPPFHGQALCLQRLVAAEFPDIVVYHAEMKFSREAGEVGQARFDKVFELFRVLGRAFRLRREEGIANLYYPPAGPDFVPVLRDVILLGVLRPFFRTTTFHFHADGLTDYIQRTRNPIWRFLLRRAYHRPDLCLKVSAGSRVDPALLEARHEQVVYNPVPAPETVPDRSGRQVERPRLLFVGSLSEAKGLFSLLTSVLALRERGHDPVMDLVGAFPDEENRQRFETWIREHDPDKRVAWHGPQPHAELAAFYTRADVFAFPTVYERETFGLVAAEAMSYALPVVATRWKGLPELITHGEDGLLVPPGETEALTAALGQILDDPELAQRLGERAAQRVREDFSLARHLAEMNRILAQVAVD